MSQSGGVNVFSLAKSIRKDGENWQDAIKRASAQLAKDRPAGAKAPAKKSSKPRKPISSGKTKSECYDLDQGKCEESADCGWVKESKKYKTTTGKTTSRKAHCALVPARTKKAVSMDDVFAQWKPL